MPRTASTAPVAGLHHTSEHFPPASSSSRAFEDAEGGYFVSLNCDRLMDCIGWKTTETVFAAIIQNEFDRFTQTRAGFVFGFSLAICSRNLWAIGNEPMTILLNDCRKFVCHDLPFFIPVSLTQDIEKHTCGGPANLYWTCRTVAKRRGSVRCLTPHQKPYMF